MAIQRGVSPIKIYRGDAYKWQYRLVDFNEDTEVRRPIDITNMDITAQARYTADNPQIWFTFPIVKTDPTNGVFEWKLTKAASEALLPVGSNSPSNAVYDIQLVVPNADPDLVQVLTFLTGSFTVTTDVTR